MIKELFEDVSFKSKELYKKLKELDDKSKLLLTQNNKEKMLHKTVYLYEPKLGNMIDKDNLISLLPVFNGTDIKSYYVCKDKINATGLVLKNFSLQGYYSSVMGFDYALKHVDDEEMWYKNGKFKYDYVICTGSITAFYKP